MINMKIKKTPILDDIEYNPTTKHTRKWKQQMYKKERFIREHSSDVIWHMDRGWSEEQAITRIMRKPGSNLEKLITRHKRISSNPNAVAFAADDIRRTKDVVEYINKHNLEDLGSEIRL